MVQALRAAGVPVVDVTGITVLRIRIDAALGFLGVPPVSPFVAIRASTSRAAAGQAITLDLTGANPAGNPSLYLDGKVRSRTRPSTVATSSGWTSSRWFILPDARGSAGS